MKDMLKRLNEKILNNDFFDKKYLQAIDIDELLDLRDNKEWSYVNILDTKSQTFLCCTSS